MYTIDPSDYVDDEAEKYDLVTLEKKFSELPWDELGCKEEDYFKRYLNREFKLSSENRVLKLRFSREDLLRAAVKYSAAIAHIAKLTSYLRKLFGGENFDLEISVDETATPTSPLEHFFIASELKRLGIRIQGLALRFVGRFEKAIDYIGDLDEFEKTFRDHVLIAKSSGPYKISIHSGSDKLSIYPIIGRLARNLFHIKTSGTSYLETLRIIARRDPSLFREIINYALACFEEDKKAYPHISTKLSDIPDPEKIADEDLEKKFLDEKTGRQLLHITYGSILTAKTSTGDWLFRDRIKEIIVNNEEEYYHIISQHFERHIKALGL
jgi:hypothetical protein